jgi:hypothetical protein
MVENAPRDSKVCQPELKFVTYFLRHAELVSASPETLKQVQGDAFL